MLIRSMLARWGLVRPPLAQDVADVQAMLDELRFHLQAKQDARGMVLWRKLHHRLQHIAETAPAGTVAVGTFSATPKPPAED